MAFSFIAIYTVAPGLKFFARYDNIFSNTMPGETTGWNLSDDDQLFIAGYVFSPVKGIKLAANYKGWSPADKSESFISTIIPNREVDF